ncbi:MAG: chemotaxis protein CheX [Planctomycetota bacterium]|jgi:chemotaxis protein CheX
MIDQAVIKEYIWESAKEAFETMIFLPIENNNGQSDPEEGAAVSLIGTITFTGQLQGSFSILCRMEGVEKIARAMLMIDEPDPIEGADVCDALGEVVNLVLGGVKARLNQTLPDIQISIPTVNQGMQIHPFPNKDVTRADVIATTSGEAMKMTMLYKT